MIRDGLSISGGVRARQMTGPSVLLSYRRMPEKELLFSSLLLFLTCGENTHGIPWLRRFPSVTRAARITAKQTGDNDMKVGESARCHAKDAVFFFPCVQNLALWPKMRRLRYWSFWFKFILFHKQPLTCTVTQLTRPDVWAFNFPVFVEASDALSHRSSPTSQPLWVTSENPVTGDN